MKKLIFTVISLIFFTSIFSFTQVKYEWKNDSVFVKIIQDFSINDFEFPASYEEYSKTLVPWLAGKSDEQKAYALEKEYAHALQAELSNSEKKVKDQSRRMFLDSGIEVFLGLLLILKIILEKRS